MSTLPQPPDETPDLAHLYEVACDLGDAISRLTARQATLLRMLGANPGASYTDPATAKIQARRRRIKASGLWPVPATGSAS